jgi:hypothetical protein
MAMFALNMMRIAMELALYNPVYEDMAIKFFEHYLYMQKLWRIWEKVKMDFGTKKMVSFMMFSIK